MPGTYSQILLHIVFSTKHREPWIAPDLAERLYPYMGGNEGRPRAPAANRQRTPQTQR